MTDKALGQLRLGMPVEALARAAGDEWTPPGPRDEGNFWIRRESGGVGPALPFNARIAADGTIGLLGFYGRFANDVDIDGLRIGMTLAEVQARRPGLVSAPEEGDAEYGIAGFLQNLPGGDIARLRFRNGALLAVIFERSGMTYPGDALRNRYARDPAAKAYDIEILPRPADRAGADNHGWCFGLPPGIAPDQWPLDPRTGHPLRHAFTLLLPDAYRRQGPDHVAVSLFDGDWSGDSVSGSEAVASIWEDGSAMPEDAELLPVWRHRRNRHPLERRMEDLLGEPYALIWLTRDEFDGPLCQPPIQCESKKLRSELLPEWTRTGAAAAAYRRDFGAPREPWDDDPILQMTGRTGGPPRPPEEIGFHYALAIKERENDPNAGVPPPEGDLFEQMSEQGYQSIWSEKKDARGYPVMHEWAEAHGANHIGGTMRPYQAHPSPSFSPYYIGFTESMGGFNFGGGTAQLDLEAVRLDWACG